MAIAGSMEAGVRLKRERAIADAVETHRAPVLSVIRKRIRDQVEAEDVYQEVFAEFIEAYDLGIAIETLGAWLVRVAQNKILDRFRRQKTRDEHRAAVLAEGAAREASEGPGGASRPDDEWMRRWLRGEIVNAVERLPPEQREVFVKHELEGKSFEEIAAETKVGVNTLLARKRYAVTFLRRHLRRIHDELE